LPRGVLARAEQSARVRVARDELRRIRELTRTINELHAELRHARRELAPQLLAETGCGVLTVANLVGEIADVTRFASDGKLARAAGTVPIPASSGRTQRHRLDHGGNRQINCALHRLAVTKGRLDPESAAYLARRQAEGKTRREAIRCLKRHLARRVWHLLQPDLQTTIPTSIPSRPKRVRTIHCNRPTGTLELT
jgi:transposase